MQIIYESCACSEEYFNKLFEISNRKPGQQVQKYHTLLMQGLIKNQVDVKAITSPPITRQATDQLYFPKHIDLSEGILYHHLPVFNVPYLKNIIIFITSFFETLKLIKKNKSSIVICDILNISATAGALLASKIFRKRSKSIGIVTDLPIDLNADPMSILVKLNNFIIDKCDGYIFLTEEMNIKLNNKNKDYLVIEGHVDINMENVDNNIERKMTNKICLYAGGVYKKYGIESLVNGFIKANVQQAELHIYGSGDFEDELVEICKRNNQIKYFGVVPNSVVIEAELRADLLINPRPTNEDYTKYSFPSKNMEYMASGTPVLTTRLPGMPKEYFDYIYTIEDESIDGIEKSLRETLNKNRSELHDKGMKAKSFVLKEKNNEIQASKILLLANNLFDRK
ncbi:glycosyltransferase [Streptococcus parasuis]|uniref:glycosyltransferase n=1 Tax=Streptococcus parasuis TaxID=1501662 RepID=UPI00240DC721|nr:glycosyltransferase [Streptococcus parasuis]WFB91438.1 glycosyltransferase [Streptococcus parasuis]